ncbi:MAG: hypothetical protein C0402_14730 [Thermodesulfovibrio sp.]|nr:hypothetical protein [Thermodesulfovibrio sp.]
MDITSASAVGKALGKDEFLKLFTSQLKYQDPLKPLDSTEFTAQLAQFSSLEQLYNLSSGMQQLATAQQQVNSASAVGLIGRTIKTADGTSGKATSISVSNGTTQIMLDNGKTVAFGDIQEIS